MWIINLNNIIIDINYIININHILINIIKIDLKNIIINIY